MKRLGQVFRAAVGKSEACGVHAQRDEKRHVGPMPAGEVGVKLRGAWVPGRPGAGKLVARFFLAVSSAGFEPTAASL